MSCFDHHTRWRETDQADEAVGSDPHFESIRLNIDPLDKELDDPRLFGGEQLGPDRPKDAEVEQIVAPALARSSMAVLARPLAPARFLACDWPPGTPSFRPGRMVLERMVPA